MIYCSFGSLKNQGLCVAFQAQFPRYVTCLRRGNIRSFWACDETRGSRITTDETIWSDDVQLRYLWKQKVKHRVKQRLKPGPEQRACGVDTHFSDPQPQLLGNRFSDMDSILFCPEERLRKMTIQILMAAAIVRLVEWTWNEIFTPYHTRHLATSALDLQILGRCWQGVQ